jgi:hypothetical protein
MVAKGKNLKSKIYDSNIALWGPTGVGKDWLIRAFIKELEFLNQRQSDQYFELFITQPHSSSVVAKEYLVAEVPNEIKPSSKFSDQRFFFRRYYTDNDLDGLEKYSIHDFIIHNDAGKNLVECLSDPNKFFTTYSALVNSRNIILALGPPGNSPDERAGEENDRDLQEIDSDVIHHNNWTKDEYLEFTESLFQQLGGKNTRNIAICLTKSDQDPNGSYDAWQLLERRYGEAYVKMLDNERKNHNIEVFITTAAGYVEKKGKITANFENGKIMKKDDWTPENTSLPFFWIFEAIERKRLKSLPMITRWLFGLKILPYPKSISSE